jgi:7-keto-8-aminopelargonate synthetase-like enzyme
VIPALVGRNDVIFADRLNHASIYDGCSLSRAKVVRFHHNDLNHLEELLHKQRGKGEALIVVESLYSMDGDRCPLSDLVQLKEKFNCLLMVDEAHATGLFGENGGGIIEEDGVSSAVDLAMGTFGKAWAATGAYIATQAQVDFSSTGPEPSSTPPACRRRSSAPRLRPPESSARSLSCGGISLPRWGVSRPPYPKLG